MEANEININYEKDDITMNKEDYQIELCQDGRFAATFDTANLLIKILQNTDYRPFIFNKKKNFRNENEFEESVEIDKTIAYFKIRDDFSIDKLYDHDPPPFDGNSVGSSDWDEKGTSEDNFRWSFDISNMHKNNGKYFIFVAVSRININEDMKGNDKQKKDDNGKSGYEREQFSKKIFKCPNEHEKRIDITNGHENIPSDNTTYESRKGIVIYHDSSEYNSHYSELSRFIILNFRGMYNIEFDDDYDFLKLNEKFEYPQNIRFILDNWYTFAEFANCMSRLLSCIYDKYFLVTRYNNDVQSLEVYDLAKMEHLIGARLVENIVNEYNDYFFSVSSLQLCFTQVNIVKLFHIENGLEIASKKFEELEKIYLLEFIDSDENLLIIGEGQDLKKGKDQESTKYKEDKKVLKFIIWDLYNTGEHELVELYDFPITKANIDDIYTRLAITSGNILQIDDDGKVSSVLKKVEKEINRKKLDKAADPNIDLEEILRSANGKYDTNRTIYYDENINFKVNDREPWLPGGSERTSYCLYYSEKGTETETLQLIVGRSTIQIWHQINDDCKNKDELPNKGEAFLEYIWSNRIPIWQEGEITRLRIKDFEYGPDYVSESKINDFYLKVYWIERNDSLEPEKLTKMTEHDEIMKEKLGKIILINEDNYLNEEQKEEKRQEITNNYLNIKIREKVIQGKDVIKKSHVARHACKALEHIRKRYKSKGDADIYKYKRLTNYIEHIIWKFAKYEPENFRLLDIRYNLMKSLILADCDRLIKFILFGYEETAKNKIDYRHVPSNKLWPGKKFLKEDDLNFSKRDELKKPENKMELTIYYCKNKYLDFFKIEPKKPENNMELAIYYCRGRELKDAIIVAYLLEYYSRNPTNCVGWMCTVSKAIPLLFEYNYDDFARKLFIRCFTDQGLSGQDPDEILPKGYSDYNSDTKFKTLIPLVKLKSDVKLKWYDIWKKFEDLINKFEGYGNFEEKSPLALRVVPFPGFTLNNIKMAKKKYNLFRNILNHFSSILLPPPRQIKQDETNKLSPFTRMIQYENNDYIYDNPAIEAVINFRWRKTKYSLYFLFLRFLIFAICFVLVSWAYLNRGFIVNGNFLLVLIIVFYYLAIYLFIIEVKQIRYRGPKKYILDLFNNFDMISIILPVMVMSMMLDDFQLSDGYGSVKETSLVVEISFSIFLLWIELVTLIYSLSSANTRFVLLRNPTNIMIKDTTTYSGNATNTLTNETLHIDLTTNFDPTSNDNPFTSFSKAMMATYFWINGNWVQRDEFDYWAVDVLTLIASILLVIVLQNMVIAYMSNVYEDTIAKSRQILLRHKANFISDYEALHIYFSKPGLEPKHIYFFSKADYFEEWYNTRSDNDKGPIYKNFEINSTLALSSIYKETNCDKYSLLTYDDNNIKMIVEDYIKLVGENTDDLIKRVIDIEEFEDMKIDLDHILEKLKKKIYKL
ncbi:21020_t:CDS:10 [Rhizophagus irregularis]|nr:21020_t:CDS:10 [Rhizophagus irregularis]